MRLDLSPLKYVIFDWDNTLAETRTALVASVNQVLAEYGLPDWDKVRDLRNPDLSFRDNFPLIFGERAKEAYARYAEVYIQNIPKLVTSFPAVQNVLNFFYCRQIPMMIMSNKDRRLMELELPQLYDPRMFEKIVCGHEAEKDKPYPEQIFYTLSGLLRPEEITPEKVWMIGDSPMDSTSAARANAQPIRIGRAIWGDEGDPDKRIVYFNTFEEFEHFLKNKAEKS